MKSIDEIKGVLVEHKRELTERFHVKEIGVFGSFVRKEQKRGSDVDVLVDFFETIDLFTFVELENYLSELLGVKVDLVMKGALKPQLEERILSEAVYV